MKISTGDILYHKLNSQPMVVIEETDDDDNDYGPNDTVQVRFLDLSGVFQDGEFIIAELFKQKTTSATSPLSSTTTTANVESTSLPIKHIGQPVDQDSNPYGGEDT